MAYTAAAVIAEARKWEGYCEKRSIGTDAQMQNKTWNAGKNNYTWFWVWLKRKGCLNLQGGAWCDGFVDFIHAQVAGVDKAKKSLNGWSGYTPTSANNYKKAGRWIPAGGTPKAGDQIFFKNDVRICHTGIVYAVDSTKVYTIEGNTSGASGVISNGGGVCKKSYKLTSDYIAGYGRPKYDLEEVKEVEEVSTEIKIDHAKSFDKKIAGSYVTTTGLNMRSGAGTSKKVVTVIPSGKSVNCYGYFTPVNGVKWYLVKYKTFTGFVSSKYLRK